jgi:hypothetical protein
MVTVMLPHGMTLILNIPPLQGIIVELISPETVKEANRS